MLLKFVPFVVCAALLLPAAVAVRQPQPAPAAAVTQNLAHYAEGKDVPHLLARNPTAAALRRAMGDAALAKARRLLANGWVGVSGEIKDGGYAVASACAKNLCSISEVAVAFASDGRAWASILHDGELTLFGNPPPDVIPLLTPEC